MRILVCNDDGIDAPGLQRLEEAARRLTDDVFVVAPDGKRTAASASLTVGRPLTMRRVGERRWSCTGTPADCVVTAMSWIFKDGGRPDLVLAGINDGRNVAEDIVYSGTLGIAREATFWGSPAIGFSRVKSADERAVDIDWLADFVARAYRARAEWASDGHWLSVNLPHRLPAEIGYPTIGRDKIAGASEVMEEDGDRTVLLVPRGRPHSFTPGDDNDLLDAGHVCVMRLGWRAQAPLPRGLFDQESSVTD